MMRAPINKLNNVTHHGRLQRAKNIGWTGVTTLLFVLGGAKPASAQYDVPQLEPGFPNPYSPLTNLGWNASAAYTPGGGVIDIDTGSDGTRALHNQIGSHIVGLTSQYGIGDELPPPAGVPAGATPIIEADDGSSKVVQILDFANTNLLVAIDEGVAVVQWQVGGEDVGPTQSYTIGPNLTRRPVRLFWTEGQYVGPRVRFGNNYEVKIWYNRRIPDPAENIHTDVGIEVDINVDTNGLTTFITNIVTNVISDLTFIAEEKIDQIKQPTIFLKNSELRAVPGASGRVLITYSRRPEGTADVRDLLGYEVVDVLEPQSSTLNASVADRLLPRPGEYDRNELFCDITRGAVDTTGQQPENVFVYKHTVGQRTGWVWAIRPTDSPWQIEIFWKSREELDVIWPFEVDIYNVQWNPKSQLCALVSDERGGSETDVFFPPTILPEVMPYQSVPIDGEPNRFIQANNPIATVVDEAFRGTKPGMITMKYSAGEDVWFESIRTVWELDDKIYQGKKEWPIGEELQPFLSEDVADDHFKEWPGFLRIPQAQDPALVGTDRWDVYHSDLYQYPIGYSSDGAEAIRSQLFAVNVGNLGVWWWHPSTVSVEEDMPGPVYWPSLVCDYQNQWPEIAPEIVIASFQGSATKTWIPDDTGSLLLPGANPYEAILEVHPDYISDWKDRTYDEGFSFETWVRADDASGQRGIMNMPLESTGHFSLFLEDGVLGAGLVSLVEVSTNEWTVQTQTWHAVDGVVTGKWHHVAMTYEPGEAGTINFYVDGLSAGERTNDVPGDIAALVEDGVQLGMLQSWEGSEEPTSLPFGSFGGHMDGTRLWLDVRTDTEIAETYGVPIESTDDGLKGSFNFDPALEDSSLPADTFPSRFGFMTITLGPDAQLDPDRSAPATLPGKTYSGSNPLIYFQNDPSEPGYNPNEEHALLDSPFVFALRSDLNEPDISEPYVLVEHTPDPESWRRALDIYRVTPTNREFPEFKVNMVAGDLIQPPPPLRSMLPDNSEKTKPDDSDTKYVFRDRLQYYWAQQAGNDGGGLDVGMRFFYPMQSDFWFPSLDTQPAPLTEIPWLSGLEDKTGSWELDGTPVRVTHHIVWPTDTPELEICDTLTLPKNDLPAVRGQKSVRIVYEQSTTLDANQDSAILIDPTVSRRVELEEVPPAMRAFRDPRSGNTFFSDLGPDLRERLFYVPTVIPEERLWLKGIFVERIGYHYLRLNQMTPDLVDWALDKDKMAGIDEDWTKAINDLPTIRVDQPDTNEDLPFDSLALVTPGLGAGFVTLIFNNSTNINMVDTGDPIDMEIIQITNSLFGGRIDVIESSNPLDKYLTLRHISDFAGDPQQWLFTWEYGDPTTAGTAPTNDAAWLTLHDSVTGRYTTVFGSSGQFGLADSWVRCRYKALNPDIETIVGTDWSDWTEPVLAEGWIKRVLKAINPFDQRIRDYIAHELNTELSMIQQAGQPYAGNIPLNLDALDEYGLIPIYQTVLDQARGLSVDSTLDTTGVKNVVNLALILAAGRLNDLYMVLGNEAYADAMNPTLALGNEDPLLAGDAPSIFAFQNVVPTLLDEELALLRGRDVSADTNPDPSRFPIHHRLPWNFTADITHGQLAYVLNYGISDLKGDEDGVVDADDAAALYPQGHGDAWGHYLAAIKSYYDLFRHPNFTWFPQLEGIRVGQVETTISALHEKKFAGAAIAKMRAGLAIVDRTYRLNYEEGHEEPWVVQRDSRTNRVWGVGEWGARVGMGGYLDWVMANALLPSQVVDTNETLNPLQVIDRTTVPELTELVLAASDVQHAVDMADRGLNPLGLGPGAVPFDISPAEIDAGQTHFEQAYTKALEALKIAKEVFDRVQTATVAIRDQNENREFDTVVLEQEQAFDRRLIDIYGFPYDEDMGPGKAYPEGYIGPDTLNYFYINRYDYFGRIPLDTATIEADVVVPAVSGNGIREYEPGEIAPRPPVDPATLTFGNIVQFISPEYGRRYEELKGDYEELRDDMTGADVDRLDIPEITSFYKDVVGIYQDVEAAVNEGIEDAIAWFDGVIGAPVDEIDNFISQWVGPDQELGELSINGPNIAYTTNHLSFWVGPNGLPMKPDSYTSSRRAEGEVQIALSQFVLALRDATKAIADSQHEYGKVVAADNAFRQKIGSQITAYYNEVNALNNQNTLNQIVGVVEKAIAVVTRVKSDAESLFEALQSATPDIAGLANDIGAAVEGPAAAAKAAIDVANTVQKLVNQETFIHRKEDIELGKRIAELNETASGIFGESAELATEVVTLALEYMTSLDALDVALQKAETFRMQYARAVAKGDLVQVEREQARRIWASDLTGQRYRNMAYQIIRNDDLTRYEQTFALAAQYVYLAAKAYDYETGLLRDDGAVGESGRTFLSQIVKARSLGRFGSDGSPLPAGSSGDPGLADIMARMAANWSVLDGRLNFNNPQTETGTFSLRKELFRIPDGSAFDSVWEQTLEDHVVADLFDVVEFRTHCLPFTPTISAEPALVIPFSSTIDFRRNFFDRPLGPGDNAYDSTHFATKVRSVGVWFADYHNAVLANQPRVYLIPVGEDHMRVPDGVGETVRSWSILDQALPIPYPLSNEGWMKSDWRVSTDVLGGEFFLRRRYPSLRAYHDDGFDESQMIGNARLIGRSVWNSKWLLIVPGGTLLADADKGLQQFINGQEIVPGSDTFDGNGVKDIKLFFQTYSYSGN